VAASVDALKNLMNFHPWLNDSRDLGESCASACIVLLYRKTAMIIKEGSKRFMVPGLNFPKNRKSGRICCPD
jgi:hypothetical protein